MKKAAFVCLCMILFLLPLNAQEILDAVLSGDLEKVKSLLNENPALVHTTDQYKNSLLYRALLKDDITMARFLIESGLDVNYAREDMGGNALTGSIMVGSLEITALILEKGADINARTLNGYTPLDIAIFDGQKEIAYFLLDKDAPLDIGRRRAESYLRASLSGGMDRITRLIIKEHEINFSDKNGRGDTFLHAAAEGGEAGVVELLIEKGLDPEAVNVYGWSPLHTAASGGHRDMVSALLNHVSSIDIRTKDGKSAANIAREFGHDDLLTFLEENGCDSGPQRFPKIDARYIDPDLPGGESHLFAPGIISQPHHFEHCPLTFSEDMQAVCWADWQRAGVSRIFLMTKKDGFWLAPEAVQIQATNPFLSPDGKRIYFTAKRKLGNGTEARDNDIFYIEKTASGWSERIDAGDNVNTDTDDLQPSVTRDGTLYFAHQGDIYRSSLVDGTYGPKEKLPLPINTDTSQSEPFISADERFMIFRSLGEGGMRAPSVYLSYRREDGSWAEPVNIAEKVKNIGLFPSLTPDGNYLISFHDGDYNWLDIRPSFEGRTF